MNRRRFPRPTGFTLLEVLLALGIFVASAAILSRLVLLGLENAEFARWQAQAWTLAESHLAQLQSGILTLEDAGTVVPEGFEDWQVTMTIDDAGVDYLKLVVIEVQNVSTGPAGGYAQRFFRFVFDEASVPAEEPAAEESAP